jgi:hypothetical protein
LIVDVSDASRSTAPFVLTTEPSIEAFVFV